MSLDDRITFRLTASEMKKLRAMTPALIKPATLAREAFRIGLLALAKDPGLLMTTPAGKPR